MDVYAQYYYVGTNELLSRFNNVFNIILLLVFTSLNCNLNGPIEWAQAHAWFLSAQ